MTAQVCPRTRQAGKGEVAIHTRAVQLLHYTRETTVLAGRMCNNYYVGLQVSYQRYFTSIEQYGRQCWSEWRCHDRSDTLILTIVCRISCFFLLEVNFVCLKVSKFGMTSYFEPAQLKRRISYFVHLCKGKLPIINVIQEFWKRFRYFRDHVFRQMFIL